MQNYTETTEWPSGSRAHTHTHTNCQLKQQSHFAGKWTLDLSDGSVHVTLCAICRFRYSALKWLSIRPVFTKHITESLKQACKRQYYVKTIKTDRWPIVLTYCATHVLMFAVPGTIVEYAVYSGRVADRSTHSNKNQKYSVHARTGRRSAK